MDTVVQKVWPTPFQPFLWGVFRVLGCFARSFDVFGKSTRNVGHSSFIPQFGQGSKKLVIPRNTYTNSLSPDCVLSTRPTRQLLHKPCMQSIAAISLCSKNCLEQLFTTSFFVFAALGFTPSGLVQDHLSTKTSTLHAVVNKPTNPLC